MPGPHLDPASLLELFAQERVTFTAGVPTIWMGILQLLDANPGAYDLSAIRSMFVGGAAVPQALIEAFEQRHGLQLVHAWGMTEMTPLGTVSHLPLDLATAPEDAKYAARAKQGRPVAVRGNPRAQRGRPRADGTARRWASSRCADRGWRPAITTAATAAIDSRTTAGSRPATS